MLPSSSPAFLTEYIINCKLNAAKNSTVKRGHKVHRRRRLLQDSEGSDHALHSIHRFKIRPEAPYPHSMTVLIRIYTSDDSAARHTSSYECISGVVTVAYRPPVGHSDSWSTWKEDVHLKRTAHVNLDTFMLALDLFNQSELLQIGMSSFYIRLYTLQKGWNNFLYKENFL